MRTLLGSSKKMLLLASWLAAAPFAAAQTTHTWTGAVSGDWSNGANWSPASEPTYNDVAHFGSSTRTAISIVGTHQVDRMDFPAGAPGYTFTLHDGSLLSIYAQSSPGATDDLGTAAFISQGSGWLDTTSITGPVSIGSLSGSGSLTLGNQPVSIGALGTNDTYSGVISNSGAAPMLMKIGGGKLVLSGANTYSGYTAIQSGTLQVDGSLDTSQTVGLIGNGLALHPATLAGAGFVGDVSMQSHTYLWPGNASPDTSLTMNSLGCNGTSDNVYTRIGNMGGVRRGTYLHLRYALRAENCPKLTFWMLGAGEPLAVGESYLIASMASVTNFTPDNLDYAMAVPGYYQAHGYFVVTSTASASYIYFVVNDIGDSIFRDGFEFP